MTGFFLLLAFDPCLFAQPEQPLLAADIWPLAQQPNSLAEAAPCP